MTGNRQQAMSVRDAAVQVLRDAKEPLRSAEITERILRQKLWTPTGKTPAATVEARICTEIKRNGDASVFVRVAPRTFGLREFGAKPMAGKPPMPPKPAPEPKSKVPAKTYSFTDAAEKVLEQSGNKQPMHFRDITRKALEMGCLDTEGRTPDATMGAQLYTSIKRAQRRGEEPRFVQHARGVFGLGRWMGHGLAYQIAQHNREVRHALRKRLLALNPKEFEEMVGILLVEMGFEDIRVIGRSGDGGVDVRATLVVGDVVRIRMAVQAKKWRIGNNVQAPDVQRVRGSLGTHDQGLIITTSDFSPGARTEAERADAVPVALMNGEQFATLSATYGLGVNRHTHEIFELGETTSAVAGNHNG